EDGIRDRTVTGVQTCALPIYLFADMSPLMEKYIAGLVTNLPELTAIFCPTINSYKRTVPGAWAPVNATSGSDNRTTAVRAISGRSEERRVGKEGRGGGCRARE